MPEALSRDKILLGPGERAEVIVDFAASQGEDLVLRSGPREDGENNLGSKSFNGPIMQFRVADEIATDDNRRTPGLDLPPLPAWTQTVTAASPIDEVWSVQAVSTAARGRSTARPSTRIASRPSPSWARSSSGGSRTTRRSPTCSTPITPTGTRSSAAAVGPAYASPARGGLPEGNVLPRPVRVDPDRRQGLGLHRQVRHALPHARPRGPRPHEPVRGRRALGAARARTARARARTPCSPRALRPPGCKRSGRGRCPAPCTRGRSARRAFARHPPQP